MNLRSELGLTFDDVLLVPQRSSIRSRQSVNTSTWLVPGVRMAIPVISANMDTVTEAPMAIAMAQAGGIGVLHRFMPIVAPPCPDRRFRLSRSYVARRRLSMARRLTPGRKSGSFPGRKCI